MSRRPAAHRRLLRLWTAGCLAVLLVLGVSWLGDWSLQWPVLLVPALWAFSAGLVRSDSVRTPGTTGTGGTPPGEHLAPFRGG